MSYSSYGTAHSTPAPGAPSTSAPLNWPAIISLATALAGAVTIVFASLPICVFAIVMGHVGLRHSARIGVGRGQAIGGLVVGYIAAIGSIILGLIFAGNFAYALANLGTALQNLPTHP